ncbi:hypothetical protein FVB32_16165 [Flagellimonas hymeniacidonis]|uniref:Uncharacterized protein n=1 Tax=Flagellimonas hymeniacidonis TaxID=2603628 RepID=A0A5C8V4Z7_9FLAO|nr:hypothetical protein [Flagellimonas hymeniacidonis]TXN36092.1 hypothetical protein FVB32_16165 [Flagellimonas hymeniacidonis]
MRGLSTIIVISTALLLLSCGGGLNVTSQAYKKPQPQTTSNSPVDTTKTIPQGIIYYLPKNLVKVDITYSIKEYTRIVNGRKNPDKYEVLFSKPIVVSSELIPDDSRAFVIDGKRLSNSFWLKSVLDFNLFPNGLIQSVTADIEDQSTEFAKNVVMTSGELAKTFVSPIGIPDGFKNVAEAIRTEETMENQVINSIPSKELSNPSQISYSNLEKFTAKSLDPLTMNSNSIFANQVSSVFNFQGKNLEQKETFFQNIIDKIKVKERNENYYIDAINGFNDKIKNAKKKDEVDFLKSQIEHFRKELKWFNDNNKVDEKLYDINFTVVIDPFHKYEISTEGKGLMTCIDGNLYRHKIKPVHLFDHLNSKFNKSVSNGVGNDGDSAKTTFKKFKLPTIEVVIEKPDSSLSKLRQLNSYKSMDGLVIRQPIQTQIKLLIDGSLITSNAINIAQLGYESVIPLNSVKGGKIQTNLKFDNATGALVNHKITNIKSSIEQSNDLLTTTQTSLTGAYDYLKYEKPTKELQKLIDQKAKLDALIPSDNTTIQNEITLIRSQMDLLKLKGELDDLIQSLEQKKEELEESDEE